MTKVSPDDLKAFGLAVKRARSLKGWTLDQLGAAVDPPVGKSLVSKIEKGRKDSLNSRTVGRFMIALALDETWIDKFLDTDSTEDSDETKAERDADLIVDRAQRENVTEGASEDLLILLANTYAEGQHKDRETAYIGLRKALAAYANQKARGGVQGNADDQFQDVMAEVAKLNDLGEVDDADALLDAAEKRMRQDHEAVQDQQGEARRQMLAQRLNQDRLRNDPAAAADRLIRDLLRQAPAGGVFWATDDLLWEWRERGETQGDPFELRVALVLANRNIARAKGPQKGSAWLSLGQCRRVIGERRTDIALLVSAEKAYQAAMKAITKRREPLNWAIGQDGLGMALREIAQREQDPDKLRLAIKAHLASLAVKKSQGEPARVTISQNNLGIALQGLGEMERNEESLRDAVSAHEAALKFRSTDNAPKDCAGSHNNLGVTYRWLGAVTADLAQFGLAAKHYQDCLSMRTKSSEPFPWATTQWNIADLALARFALDPNPALLETAELHVLDAREVFAEGSDHQTARCDDLLAQIAAARAAA